MRYFIKYWPICLTILLALFISSLYSTVHANNLFKIAVIVGEDAISTKDVDDRIKVAIFVSGVKDTPQTRQDLFPQIIQVLIDETLYKQEANRLNLTISEREVQNSLRTVEKKNDVKHNNIESYFKDNDVPMSAVRNQIEAQLLWNKVIAQKIRPSINVTSSELDEQIEFIAHAQGEAEANLSEIVIPILRPEDEGPALKLAKKLIEEINSGAKFSKIAREFSRGITAKDDGNIGWIEETSLSPTLQRLISTMKAGEISTPVRIENSYYIIRLNDKRAIINNPISESEFGIKQAFVPITKGASPETKTLTIDRINRRRNNIASCSEFDAFSKNIGSVIPSTMTMIQLKQLNKDIANAIRYLKIGKTSRVVQNDKGYFVFIVCEKTEAQPTLASKQKVESALLRKKINLEVQRFIQTLRRDTFTDVRDN